jgi:hypothetical protein
MPLRHLEYTLLCSRTIPVYTQQRSMRVVCWTNSSVASLPLTAVGSWCQRWNMKINEGKTRAMYFSKRRRMLGDDLQLNGQNIPFVNSVKYLGVIFDRRMTWRLHIEKIAAKALGTCIGTYSIFRSKHLNANIKLIVYRALIRSIMTYICPTWEFAADNHSMKLQRLQNRCSALLATLTGAHRSAICIWRSKFRTCTIA